MKNPNKDIDAIPLHPALRRRHPPRRILDAENVANFQQTSQSVRESVRRWGPSLQYVRPECITFDLCKEANEHHSGAISFVPREHFSTDEYNSLCLLAVGNNGFTLKEIPRDAITADIVEAAHRHTCCAIMDTPREFLTEELCWRAIRRNGEMLEYVPNELQSEEMKEAAADCVVRRNRERSEKVSAMSDRLMRDGELTCRMQ